ncbi:MAG TPA: hypothetical protein ENH23_02965 [candidate division Zixibacteria bacterium]|nr:hypothetical protein [candidate division Zixibacteria bacterium]
MTLVIAIWFVSAAEKRLHNKWDSKTKAKVVVEGLSEMSVSEVCTKYQISKNQYYLWQYKFLSELY